MRRVADRASFASSGWGWVVASGILLLLAGAAAFVAPVLTTLTASIFAGWLLLIVGIAGIVMGTRTKRHHGRWSDLLYGVASVCAGLFIIFDPGAGAASLALALAIWFAMRGAIEIGGAVRVGPGRGRIVLIVIGAIDLLLACLLLADYPVPAVQAVGLFLGISFVMAGAATIATGLQLRRIAGA